MSARIGYLLQGIAGKPLSLVSLIATRPTTTLYPTNLRSITFAFRTKVTSAAKKTATTKKASTAKKAVTRKATTGRKTTAANAKPKAKTRKSATAKKPVKKKVTKAVAKKKAKKAAKPVKKKATLKRKKVLTDEQKFLAKVKEAKSRVLRPPPSRNVSAYNMYCRESLLSRPSDEKGFVPITGESARAWNAMDMSEKAKYSALAKETNDRMIAEYNKFLQGYTVEETQKANNARRWLKSKGIKRVDTTPIKDPRKPPRPTTSFLHFVRTNYNTFEATDFPGKGKAAGKAWNALSDDEKKPYIDMFLAEKEKVKSQVSLTS